MKRLLKSGVDVNCRHPLGWTALHTAIVNANWPVVEFLVDNGVDINSKDEFSSAPRMAAQERAGSTQGIHTHVLSSAGNAVYCLPVLCTYPFRQTVLLQCY